MLAHYYIIIYLLVCSITLLVVSMRYNHILSYSTFLNRGRSSRNVSVLLLAVILFVGLRPVHYAFADMVGYNEFYNSILGTDWNFQSDAENLIFDNMFTLFASLNIPSELYFLANAVIYFGCMFLACKKMFQKDYEFAFLICLTAFSTFSYATNGIKAGNAASIFLLALAYKDKLWLTIMLAFISWGFHHSMSVVFSAYLVSFFYKKTKWYFYLWVLCFIISFLHISFFQNLFASLTDEKGAGYLMAESDYAYLTGFRPDFIAYSSAPVIIGYWLFFKKKVENEGYNLWLRMYLLTNSLWMLCMHASFSNRIAYLSWFLYPIVLIYPFIAFYWGKRQFIYARRVGIYHMLFTLFMQVIYYSIIKS